jgi:uncharacterized protein
MIRDDKQRVIGKLVNINSEKFTVELLNQSINFTVNGFDDIYQYAQINGYVILPYQDFYIVAEIFGVRERDADIKWRGEKEQVLSKSNSVKYLDITPIGTIHDQKFKYGVSVFPTLYSDVLYVKKEELDIVFEVEVETEYVVIEEEEGSRLKLLDIGTSTIFPDYKVKIDINSFFGSHSAILGNTGSGKSCTIASMMQNLLKKEYFSAVGASFVFFDVNGEYHKAFSQITNSDIEIKYFSLNELKNNGSFEYNERPPVAKSFKYEEFKLPHWFLNIEEWALLLQASEKTQLPMLRSALGFTVLQHDAHYNHIVARAILHTASQIENSASKGQRMYSLLADYAKGNLNHSILTKHHFNSQFGSFNQGGGKSANENQENFMTEVATYLIPDFQIPTYKAGIKYFDFKKLDPLLDLAILFEEAHGNKQIRDYCSSLITRFKNIKDRSEFEYLSGDTATVLLETYINALLGIDGKGKRTQISIIDLNSVEDEIVEVISCVLSRMIFDKLKKLKPRNSFPVNIVLEEAHRYISNNPSSVFGNANKVFERIAKEGRKYGLFLLASSQRPSELSRTVLSQCSNFIIHRIQNPEDLSQIRQMTPHISASILSRLPSIPRQHALVFGQAVQIPTLFKVNEADPTPHSHDNDVTKNWFKPKKNDFPIIASTAIDDLPF